MRLPESFTQQTMILCIKTAGVSHPETYLIQWLQMPRAREDGRRAGSRKGETNVYSIEEPATSGGPCMMATVPSYKRNAAATQLPQTYAGMHVPLLQTLKAQCNKPKGKNFGGSSSPRFDRVGEQTRAFLAKPFPYPSPQRLATHTHVEAPSGKEASSGAASRTQVDTALSSGQIADVLPSKGALEVAAT